MISTHAVGRTELVSLCISSAVRTLEQIGAVFPDVDAAQMSAAVGPGDTVTWSFNMPLLKIGDQIVLVDTGFSFMDQAGSASTHSLLLEAGVRAEDVDTVVITHAHGDHIGGLLHDSRAAFGKATLVIHRAEYEFWTGAAGAEHYGVEATAGARAAFAAYEGRTRLIEGETSIVENVDGRLKAIHIPGHTPGHLGLDLVSGEAEVSLLTDTLHTEIQLAHVSWSPRFDFDSLEAAASRDTHLKRVSERGTLTHLYHFPFPGVGRIRAAETAYFWDALAQ